MMIRILGTLLMLVSQPLFAQPRHITIPDSLKGKDCHYLGMHVSLEPRDSVRSSIYAQAWLAKAKLARDCRQTALAYKAVMYTQKKSLHLQYADSIIVTLSRCPDKASLGNAYMTRGIVHYERKEITKALDDYLTADRYISQTNDPYLVHKVKYGIALTKYYLGFYDEAIALFRQCVTHFEQENDRAYLNSLHMLGLCYNRVEKWEESSKINALGIAAGRELDQRDMEPYFILSQGVNEYFMGKYGQSINHLSTALVRLNAVEDISNQAVAHFYLGKSSLALHQEQAAIRFFKKVDAAFESENYLRPDLRESYEILINNAKKNQDKAAQLHYINRLLKVDSMLHQNYRYLSSKLFRQYDTAKLLQARRAIEQSMQNQKILGGSIIVLLVLAIGWLLQCHYANQRKYLRKFEELMARKPEPTSITQPGRDAEFDLNPELVAAILKNLEKFEKTKRYLEKDMTLVRMAERLQTNTKYVTKIIQRYRDKGTIEYISDLKIDHVVELLKTENRYRNYTNKALAEEVGFGSTQNFTRAFKARNGISPTYFIQELKKDLQEYNSN